MITQRNINKATISTAMHAIELIRDAMYADGPDADWSADTLEDIAAILASYYGVESFYTAADYTNAEA